MRKEDENKIWVPTTIHGWEVGNYFRGGRNE